ncbi:hypothetical protein WMF20_21375 [Sorangium sp. So ce834]|uniref:hypothetical protein n=1 Tax=Sorangium sp. So ce834 TaxID=3133321 RepID=UPI003F611FF5
MENAVKEQESTNLFVEMEDAFSQLEHKPLRDVLLDSVRAEERAVQAINASFRRFTEKQYSVDALRTFFASWQRTNNSAMSVQGLANRITAEAEAALGRGAQGQALDLSRAAGRLHRVTDEDLGVKGQHVHFELYYRMASGFCGGDDAWQSRAYCLPSAVKFKAWLEAVRLREPIMVGLFSMLVHEGYTHAELEVIAPWFERWASGPMSMSHKDARRLLAWIHVHNGGTEKAHFAHSCAALDHYCSAVAPKVDLDHAGEVFRTYLRLKSAAMQQIADHLF